MSFIISVYSRQAFKEYLLPTMVNDDYYLTLDKEYYNLDKNMKLHLEVLDGLWRLKTEKNYSFEKTGISEENYLKDEDVYKIISENDQIFYLFVREVKSPFRSFAKFSIKNKESILIGRDQNCSIVYDYGQGFVSRTHAEIRKDGSVCRLKNYSENPTYVNERLIPSEAEYALSYGDIIHIFGLKLVYLYDILAVDMSSDSIRVDESVLHPYVEPDDTGISLSKPETDHAGSIFRRSIRSFSHLPEGNVEIEDPPVRNLYEGQPMFTAVGPSLTMALPMILGCAMMITVGKQSGLYMYAALLMAIASAVIGVYWGWKNIYFARSEAKRQEAERVEAYGTYIAEKMQSIETMYENTVQTLKENYPDASECAGYDSSSMYLWSRNTSHEDFLTYRLGIGNRPFQVGIQVSKKEFHVKEDELRDKPLKIKEQYETLYQVPITKDITEDLMIGIVGGKDKNGALEIVKSLVVQIASCNSYSDVKMAFIYDQSNAREVAALAGVKWLPHVWSANRRIRYLSPEQESGKEVFYELAQIFRKRKDEQALNARSDSAAYIKPYYVVFVSDVAQLEGEPVSKYLFGKDKACGLTTVVLCDSYEALPNNCDFVIQNDEQFQGIYHVTDQVNERIPVVFDQISDCELDAFAHRITGLTVQEVDGGEEIPDSLTFFDMYQISRPEDYPVKDMWAKNKIYENIKVLVGQLAGGKNCYLDVHEKYHGPHGLVAGTTGSGKSETLQTYILSLAMNYSPDDVGFFIIDYKGGGMASLFHGLPHMIGQISNLSDNQVVRAMVSIKSENRRRQRVFSANGVNHINAYTKLYKNGEASIPVPHLFIIVDEFAELKREEPEFMKELISVAQVGRSLGVHLILATQKPSGTVDENIWSNSRFKLCLRVQDRQDSMDMLHKADAAYISQAGRAYLQVGNDEICEQFQSGYSGAIYEESITGSQLDIARLIRIDGTVELSGEMAKITVRQKAQYRWILQLVEITKMAFDSVKCMESVAVSMEMLLQQAIPVMFEALAVRNIDYPENQYNSQRLADFARLLSEAECKLTEDDDLILSIIKLSKDKRVKLPEPKEHTQLDAMKEHLAAVARENGYLYEQLLWLPVLRNQIGIDDVEAFDEVKGIEAIGNRWSIPVTIGQFDDPANQNQPMFVLDLAKDENVAVCGSVASGKSTLLQTIAYSLIRRYREEIVNLYILDFSTRMMSALEEAPHVKGIYYDSDVNMLDGFFRNISDMLEARKQALHGGSFSQFVQKYGVEEPAVVIMIDNFAAFNEKTDHIYEDDLIRLSKEGLNHGIYLILSGGGFNANDIISRIADNLKTVICLQLKDKYAYGDLLHTMQIETMPEQNVKGRGIALFEKRALEFQACLAINSDNDYQRMELIRESCRSLAGRDIAKSVDHHEEPGVSYRMETGKWREKSLLTYNNLCMDEDYISAVTTPEWLPVGFDAKTGSAYSIPLKETLCYLVTGEENSGKTNFMKVCIQSVLKSKGKVVVIDSKETALYPQYEANPELTYIRDGESFFNFLQSGFMSELTRRNQIKNQIMDNGGNWDEVFERLSKEPAYYLFIADFENFVRMVDEIIAGRPEREKLPAILTSYMKAGRCHNVYFFAEVSSDKRDELAGNPMFYAFENHKTGIHFGGMTYRNHAMDFSEIDSADVYQTTDPNIGLIPDTHYGIQGISRVKIPLLEEEE